LPPFAPLLPTRYLYVVRHGPCIINTHDGIALNSNAMGTCAHQKAALAEASDPEAMPRELSLLIHSATAAQVCVALAHCVYQGVGTQSAFVCVYRNSQPDGTLCSKLSPARGGSLPLCLLLPVRQEEILAKCPPVYDGEGQLARLRRQAVCNSLGLCCLQLSPSVCNSLLISV